MNINIPKEPTPKYFVAGETSINRAVDEVWGTLSDFHGLEAWTQRVKKVYVIGEVERGPGTARHCEVKGLGKIDEIITTWEEGRKIGYRVSGVGPIGVAFSLWELDAEGADTTRVRLRLDYNIRYGILGKLLHSLLLQRILASNVPRVLGTLKGHLESASAS